MKYSSLFFLLLIAGANPIFAEETQQDSVEDEFAFLLELPEPQTNAWQGFLNYSWNQEQDDYAMASALLGWQHDQDVDRYFIFNGGSDDSTELLQASLRSSGHLGRDWVTLRGGATYSNNREGGYATRWLSIGQEITSLVDLDLLLDIGHLPLQLILGLGQFDQNMDYALYTLAGDEFWRDQLDLQLSYYRFGFKWDRSSEKSMMSGEAVLLYSFDDLNLPQRLIEGDSRLPRYFIDQLQLLKWQLSATFYPNDYIDLGRMLSVLVRGQWPLKEGMLPYWWESVGGPGGVSGYGTVKLDTEKLLFVKLEQRWIKNQWQPFVSASGAWFDLAIPLQETDSLSYESDSLALGLGAGLSWLPNSHFRCDLEAGIAVLAIEQAVTLTSLSGFSVTRVNPLAEAGDTSVSLQFYYYF